MDKHRNDPSLFGDTAQDSAPALAAALAPPAAAGPFRRAARRGGRGAGTGLRAVGALLREPRARRLCRPEPPHGEPGAPGARQRHHLQRLRRRQRAAAPVVAGLVPADHHAAELAADRGRRAAAREAAGPHHGRRVRAAAAAGREPAAARTGAGTPGLPARDARRQAGGRHAPAHRGVRHGARPAGQLVGDLAAHPGAFGPGLPAGEPARHLAALPGSVCRHEGAAARGHVPRAGGGVARDVPRRRRPAHRAAHARAVQRNLFRARVPRALPGPDAGRRQRPHGARRAPVPQDAAGAGAGARHPQAPGRRIPRPAGAAIRFAPGRAGPAAGDPRGQRAGGQRARLGLPRIDGAAGLPARAVAPPAGRRAEAAVAGHLVVRRTRRDGSGAAAAGHQRDQADLRQPGCGRDAGAHALAARAGRMGRPHRAAPGRAHGAGVPAAVADAHLEAGAGARPDPAALADAARVRRVRRRAVVARAARRPDAHRQRHAGDRVDAARRQQRRHLGADRRRGGRDQPAAPRPARGRDRAPQPQHHQPRGREPVLAGPLHRAHREHHAAGAPGAGKPQRRGPGLAAAAGLAGRNGGGQCAGAAGGAVGHAGAARVRALADRGPGRHRRSRPASATTCRPCAPPRRPCASACRRSSGT